jgi:hypothetical protein
MSQITPLHTFASPHQTVISWITQRLTLLGLVVRSSFDLQVAKSVHLGCDCPHHGTEQCDCQIVVLLVYDQDEGPVSLVVHSQDGTTILSMANQLSVLDDKTLAGKIDHALEYQIFTSHELNIGGKSE